MYIVDIGFFVIFDIFFNFILVLDNDKIFFFLDVYSLDFFLFICFDSGNKIFVDDKICYNIVMWFVMCLCIFVLSKRDNFSLCVNNDVEMGSEVW